MSAEKKERTGNTPPRQFRLSEETIGELQALADAYTDQTGITHSRADIIRLLVRREFTRMKGKIRPK